MSTDSLEALLRQADESAPRLELRPPCLADLEHRRRVQIARRSGGVLVALAIVTATAWTVTTVRAGHRAELLSASTESLTRSLAELDGSLNGLRAKPERTASAASEEAAMTTFRALHRSADAGDPHSIEGMRLLARRFSGTHGGQCAALFLTERNLPRTERQELPVPSEPQDTR